MTDMKVANVARRAAAVLALLAVAAPPTAGVLRAQETPDDLPRLEVEDLFRRNIGDRSQMSTRFPPHRVMDNLYYVGTHSLSSYLVTTPEGHVLVNSCFERTVPLIRRSVEELGFDFDDVRVVLGSHAHGDHQEGDALVKEMTGARIMVMAEDLPLWRDARPDDRTTPVDRVLHDGDRVRLGGETLIARRTPGHTPGCTSWEIELEEDGRSYTALINCSVGVNPGYQLHDNPDRPNIVEDYRYSYRMLRSLDVDVPLASHPAMYGMAEKHERIGETPNPFIDPEGFRREIALNEQAMELKLAEQRRAAGSGNR